jgi:hypothetical protein
VTGCRVHHTAVLDANTAHYGCAPITFSNTAMRMATPFST